MAGALGLSLGRTRRDADWTDRAIALAVLPGVTAAGVALRALLAGPYAVLGAALFVLVAGATVWVRRWGARATAAGALASMPLLLVVLVVPVGLADAGWAAVIALLTCCVVLALHLLTGPPPQREADAPRRGRPPAGTKMAVQLALALTLSFLAGRLVLGGHWQWAVLTAFLVCAGNRGRADVAYKGVLRIIGAAVGAGAVTLLLPLLAGSPEACLWAAGAALAAGVWSRPSGYAYWAGCVTAALAFVYASFGQSAFSLLTARLAGILLGGVIAVVVSWYVLPVRSDAVARLRLGECARARAAYQEVRREGPAGSADGLLDERRERLDRAVARMEETAPPFEAWRRLLGRWSPGARRHADRFDELRAQVARAVQGGSGSEDRPAAAPG
jgi:hypothetical protein